MNNIETLIPTSAIVLYATNHHSNMPCYAQTHPINVSNDGVFNLLEGTPLCKNKLREAILDLAQESKTINDDVELLPENILAYQPVKRIIVWYQPSQSRIIHFNSEETKTSFKANWPAMLFMVKESTFTVFSLKNNQRPKSKDTLFHAPIWNVDNIGGVCVGSANAPSEFGIRSMQAWENVIYDSAFSHPNGSIQRTKSDDFIKVWEDSKERKFPFKELIKSNNTLDSLLKKHG